MQTYLSKKIVTTARNDGWDYVKTHQTEGTEDDIKNGIYATLKSDILTFAMPIYVDYGKRKNLFFYRLAIVSFVSVFILLLVTSIIFVLFFA